MSMLRAKLYELELRKRNEAKAGAGRHQIRISAGASQIRSYVFDQSRIRICVPATKSAISRA